MWPLAHVVNFRFIPNSQRVLYINAVNVSLLICFFVSTGYFGCNCSLKYQHSVTVFAIRVVVVVVVVVVVALHNESHLIVCRHHKYILRLLSVCLLCLLIASDVLLKETGGTSKHYYISPGSVKTCTLRLGTQQALRLAWGQIVKPVGHIICKCV